MHLVSHSTSVLLPIEECPPRCLDSDTWHLATLHRDALLTSLRLCFPKLGCPPARTLILPQSSSPMWTPFSLSWGPDSWLWPLWRPLNRCSVPLPGFRSKLLREGKEEKDVFLGRRMGTGTLIQTRVVNVECGRWGAGRRWGMGWKSTMKGLGLEGILVTGIGPCSRACLHIWGVDSYFSGPRMLPPAWRLIKPLFIKKPPFGSWCFLCWLRTLTWLNEQEGWLLLCFSEQKRLLIKLSGSLCLRYFKKWNLEISSWTEFELHSKLIEQQCFRSF